MRVCARARAQGETYRGNSIDNTTIGVGIGVSVAVGALLAGAAVALSRWRSRRRGWKWVHMEDNLIAANGKGVEMGEAAL